MKKISKTCMHHCICGPADTPITRHQQKNKTKDTQNITHVNYHWSCQELITTITPSLVIGSCQELITTITPSLVIGPCQESITTLTHSLVIGELQESITTLIPTLTPSYGSLQVLITTLTPSLPADLCRVAA